MNELSDRQFIFLVRKRNELYATFPVYPRATLKLFVISDTITENSCGGEII